MDACTDTCGHELKPAPQPLLVVPSRGGVSLIAGSPADALLIGRLAAILASGDASVRLTVLLDLYDRYQSAPAAPVGGSDADAQEQE